MWASLASPPYRDWAHPGLPTSENYGFDLNLIDPMAIESTNPAFLHYLAAWSHLSADRYAPTVDAIRDIDRSIDLGNSDASVHRIRAEVYLSWALGNPWLNLLGQFDGEAGKAWRED